MIFFVTLLFLFIIFCAVWVLIRLFYIPEPQPFVLYFGPPRCGKTTFLTRLAVKKLGSCDVFSNYEITHPGIYSYEKKDLGRYAFPDYSLLLFDEGSLNGFDNRDYKTNFNDPALLEYFKLIGHHRNTMVFSNQGFDELDKKIRTLTTEFWLVKKFWRFSYAIRLVKFTDVDKISSQVIDGYVMPSGRQLLFSPKYFQIIYRPPWCALFNSYSRPELPPIEKKEWIGKECEV